MESTNPLLFKINYNIRTFNWKKTEADFVTRGTIFEPISEHLFPISALEEVSMDTFTQMSSIRANPRPQSPSIIKIDMIFHGQVIVFP